MAKHGSHVKWQDGCPASHVRLLRLAAIRLTDGSLRFSGVHLWDL